MIIHSLKPFVCEFDSDLPDVIFDRLLEQTNYSQSQGYDYETRDGIISDWRVSYTYCDMKRNFNNVTKMLLYKVYDLTGHEYFLEQTEEIQLTKYLPGGYFKKHTDNFNHPGYEKNHIENDRIATVILYLNDNYEGGETHFTTLDITIKPKRGKVCYFSYPLNSNTNLLEHEAKPLISGQKNIIQIWIRENKWNHQLRGK